VNAVILGIAGIVIAMAALAAALWQGTLLRRQLTHASEVSSAQFYQNITVQWLEVNRVWLEHPRLWAYFHADEQPPDDDQAELMCMGATVANLAEICVNSKRVLGEYSGDWERYFRYVYLHSPFFQDFWRRHSVLWPGDVGRVFLSPIAEVELPAAE
jgi:hypothetical protein